MTARIIVIGKPATLSRQLLDAWCDAGLMTVAQYVREVEALTSKPGFDGRDNSSLKDRNFA